MISGTILANPMVREGRLLKGAVILSRPDDVCAKLGDLGKYFYIIERRGWVGQNDALNADIKLVEDVGTIEETKRLFPESILLTLSGADFVDTESFRPLGSQKRYTGIQISCWRDYKRHELFVKAASLLPEKSFLKFGHFVYGGTPEEVELKKSIMELSDRLGANISFPFRDVFTNKGLPSSKASVNRYINLCSMGILTTRAEGVNRFKMECLSANIPCLVASDVLGNPTKKHINQKTGILFEPTPEELAGAILKVLSGESEFRPREYVLKTTGHHNSLKKLKAALRMLCEIHGTEYRFEDIYWDGRNQSLMWGTRVIEKLSKVIKKQREALRAGGK